MYRLIIPPVGFSMWHTMIISVSDFDEEAERERLREKYEKDAERRAETQQMSELLLKGATMTNAHCETCGSPIFRYEGQEFCPTCQSQNAERNAADNGSVNASDSRGNTAPDNSSQSASADTATASNAQANTQPSTEADTQADTTPAPESSPADQNTTVSSANADRSDTSPTVEPVDTTVQPNTSNSIQSQSTSEGDVTPTQSDPSRHSRGDNDTVAEVNSTAHTNTSEQRPAETAPTRQTAIESLREALTRHAQLAAASDDPRRARDHLRASNEAAEALKQLR